MTEFFNKIGSLQTFAARRTDDRYAGRLSIQDSDCPFFFDYGDVSSRHFLSDNSAKGGK